MQFLLNSDGTFDGTELFIDGKKVESLESIKIVLNDNNEIIEIGMSNDKLEEQMESLGYKKDEFGVFSKE